jgi:hypothetical protein
VSRRWDFLTHSVRLNVNQPISLQITASRFDQPSLSQRFKQPSSTSTVALSTASLSTSTKKSKAMHELTFHPQLFLKNPIAYVLSAGESINQDLTLPGQ